GRSATATAATPEARPSRPRSPTGPPRGSRRTARWTARSARACRAGTTESDDAERRPQRSGGAAPDVDPPPAGRRVRPHTPRRADAAADRPSLRLQSLRSGPAALVANADRADHVRSRDTGGKRGVGPATRG